MKNKRILYIDILNIIAIIAVVILHHNGIVHGYSRTSAWYTSLIFECIFYFAVPLFLMISGAMLMPYREKYDTKTFFKKRALKVLIPAIAWIATMIIWKVFIAKTMTIEDWSPKNILNIIFASKEETTYYYLFLIMGAYLTMPVLSRLSKPEYRKTAWYLVGVFFIFNALIPNLLKLAGVTYNTDFGLMMGQWCMYIVLGYLLSTQDIAKKYRVILYSLGILSIVYRYATTIVLSNQAGKLVNTTWGYGQFHTILLSSAVFVFVKNMNLKWIEKHVKLVKTLGVLAGCSFGIYLVHKIVMFYEIRAFNIDTVSIWWRTIGFLMTYLISLIIIWILKKIPLVKKMVP